MAVEKNDKPRQMATAAEVDKISRAMLVWANTFPEKPVAVIQFENLRMDPGEETAMALSTIQGTYIVKRFILGGYRGEYQFKIIYRIKPEKSNNKRLQADELLNRFGDWARVDHPDLGQEIRALRVEAVTQSSKFASYDDGYEDYQILMKLTYEVGV